MSVISVKKPSGLGGSEVVWMNLKKEGINFKNISLGAQELPLIYKKIPNIFHLREIFAARWLIKKSLQSYPDIIIYDKIFGWSKFKFGGKKICYNHGSYTIAGLTFKKKNHLVYLIYKYIVGYFEKKSYENADKIIAVSASVKNEMVNHFGISENKIFIVNNGVNLRKFRPMKNKLILRERYKLPINKKVIFFPGRASFGKGFDIAENVLERLGEGYFMLVLGRGRSLLKNIKFIGNVNNEKMPEIYNSADVCLFPSRYEGSSVSVLESAACGIPLALSDVGEMKTNKKMKKFICNNVNDYVKCIKSLTSKDSEAWRNFSKNFSIEKQIKDLRRVLKNGL